MITLSNVTLPGESTRFPALAASSLTIRAGEVVSLLGATAAVRRRLLAVLGLHADEWTGEYELFGCAVHRLDATRRSALRGALVGAMTRTTPLVDCLSVEENVEIPLSVRGVPVADRPARIGAALSMLGIESLRGADACELAADERQLVGIAKALVSRPRLVLLEEPDLYLSPLQILLVEREIGRLCRDGAIVVRSESRSVSRPIADRVIDLDEWRSMSRAASTRARVAGRGGRAALAR
jgi:putative ABC transport system ATP-binding protein